MISAAFIAHGRSVVPWAADHHVEHDLVISGVLVELFSDASLARALAFRGGTAIHKLLLASPVKILGRPIWCRSWRGLSGTS